jgi:hypothetical protein
VRLSIFALLIGSSLCLVLPGKADVCATPGNVVTNCAFADGTYTATIPYLQPPNSDPGVPDFWDADVQFVEGYLQTGEDAVVTNPVTGVDYLSMATGQFGPEEQLSQNLTDISGVTYDIYGVSSGNGYGPFFVLIDGEVVDANSAGISSFVGTGNDEITLDLGPNSSLDIDASIDINYVVVAPAGVSLVPEPRSVFLLPFAMLLGAAWLKPFALRAQRALS